jgi:acetylornithine deacetylase/succinyl-diaminopimelate desuccinylase-like protein
VDAIRAHARRVLGEDIPALGVPLYADARLYAEHGVPIVMYGAGPRTIAESNAKRADENLVLEDLRNATRIVASAVADLLRR